MKNNPIIITVTLIALLWFSNLYAWPGKKYRCAQYKEDSAHGAYCDAFVNTVAENPSCYSVTASNAHNHYHVFEPLNKNQHPAETSTLFAFRQVWNGECNENIADSFFLGHLRVNPYYPRQQFTKLMKKLFHNAEMPKADTVLIPGAGVLFELPEIIELMEPKKIRAIEPHEIFNSINKGLMSTPPYKKKIDLLHEYNYHLAYIGKYCPKDIDCKNKNNFIITQMIDSTVLFLHPGPLNNINETQLSAPWGSIIDESLKALELGGYAIFILMSKQQVQLIENYFEHRPNFEQPVSVCGPGEFMQPFHEPTARIYACGLRVKKTSVHNEL